MRTRAFVALTAALVVGYVGLAFALGESYPLSPLGMFSRPQGAATRVVARTSAGALAEVTAFDEWSCDRPLALQGVCSPLDYSAQDERVMQTLRERPRSSPEEEEEEGRETVELVRLIFRIRGAGAPLETEACRLAICRARALPRR